MEPAQRRFHEAVECLPRGRNSVYDRHHLFWPGADMRKIGLSVKRAPLYTSGALSCYHMYMNEIITVSQFVGIINDTMQIAYPEVTVEGEVSSFKINQGKFIFFDLKDENATLSCFMMLFSLKLPIQDGMKIRVTGTPKVTKFSKFSLTVRRIEISGEGDLRRAMELLKAKLDAEGLFDPSRKRPLPIYPQAIGLITSGTSAAYADFIKIIGARWGGIDIQLADVTVQGVSAPDQIVRAIGYFNRVTPPVDVLVLIRGGGSLDDLSAFSTEPVARAVAESRTPIVVGVGHEVDVSLADYAADVRAATPTDAARLVVPDRLEASAQVEFLVHRIDGRMEGAIDARNVRIERNLTSLVRFIGRPLERVRAAEQVLTRGFEKLVGVAERQSEARRASSRRLVQIQTHLLSNTNERIAGSVRLLASHNPQAVLSRGYAIVRHHGRVAKDPATVQPGDKLVIQLAKGSITVEAGNDGR